MLLPLMLAAACNGDPIAPREDQPGGGFGSGTSGGGASPATSLVGVWQTVVVLQVPGDVQTWTTTWQFDAEGTCREIKVTESLAEGFPRTSDLACTWTASNNQITVAFVGGGSLVMEFSFAGLSPDRLVLDGFEYQRQS
jgi:hypothetical protein